MKQKLELPIGMGWIYIMMTPSDYNRVKIGMTIHNPRNRLRELKTGDPYLAINAAYFIPNKFGQNLKSIEDKIHTYFNNIRIHFLEDEDRVKVRSEWFSLEASESQWAVDDAFRSIGFEIGSPSNNYEIKPNIVAKYYDSDLVYEPCPFALSFKNQQW
jgi:hypothetical protein